MGLKKPSTSADTTQFNGRLGDVENKLNAITAEQNRQSQVLKHGLQVINASMDSPVDIEIQGRTLISIGNSNLDNGKSYVLADKKTKVRIEGRNSNPILGVGKFQKNTPLTRTANFVGKVSGSTTENPHKMQSSGGATLLLPTNFNYEPPGIYPNVQTLNGTSSTSSVTTNTHFAEQLFSFNIIEEIERNMGRIPKSTVAEKVQWLKDNVNSLKIYWHGFGSSVGGNRATLAPYTANFGYIETDKVSHTNSVVSSISRTLPYAKQIVEYIDSNGFVHFLAYAEPSDGITPSVINTDYVELVIELKSTAVLDTRPILIRTANFEGKVKGSTVENPHIGSRTGGNANNPSLLIPSSGAFQELTDTEYGSVNSLNSVTFQATTTVAGSISQKKFSFDIVQEIERQLGRIPKATLADKIQWVKDNVNVIRCAWHGFGSSVGGNKATIATWNASSSTWSASIITAAGIVTKKEFQISTASIPNTIDASGFTHIVAYAEPSDGTTPSVINTDYVELEIELKDSAVLHDPLVPLYEVDATEYANILVAWNESEVLNRYPRVQGVQHLQNVAVIAEGENLLPPFTEWASIHANAKVLAPYELELNAIAGSQQSSVVIAFMQNTAFTITPEFDSMVAQPFVKLDYLKSDGSIISSEWLTATAIRTSPANCAKLQVTVYNAIAGKTVFKNLMLTLGSTSKPFVPRNPSYLFHQGKLGQIGSVKDVLYKSDGQWVGRKAIEKDVVLDGTYLETNTNTGVGFKVVSIPKDKLLSYDNSVLNPIFIDNYGRKIKCTVTSGIPNIGEVGLSSLKINYSVPNSETGFGETYSPILDEWKAYFNGWQAKTVDANGKPTAWRSLGDGTDAPTQTLAYVSANKAPNFTPYKLSYVLASPQQVAVQVEGDIAVSGPTQVEVTSGVIVREKASPQLYATNNTYYINETLNRPLSKLSNKAEKFLSIYKNGIIDRKWVLYNSMVQGYGKQFAYVPTADYDTTAEYTVTYLVLDRHLFTNNALEVKASYETSLKKVVDNLVEKQADIATLTSVHVQAIAELYKRIKALGG